MKRLDQPRPVNTGKHQVWAEDVSRTTKLSMLFQSVFSPLFISGCCAGNWYLHSYHGNATFNIKYDIHIITCVFKKFPFAVLIKLISSVARWIDYRYFNLYIYHLQNHIFWNVLYY